ncbi:glycerol-3-phosphate acyltransferase PlsY [Desulfobaculum xiamenense]|uniref:Glycerol-3-phosphate acyltransferase n=1 Tax=Desulfobaculum xiamenense TaxID=995050 RepID=A0A846QVX6_9BACT|nr:glycerol-3-phosphate 1-O-acyltransferase PlsY [Desulfobaculum xiamenense]NJB69274.1 glycerol-3-phosphate acyltransferase PlsY [Desulfobaculum xiamenense]
MLSLGWIAITYLLGSIPFGLFVAKACCGVDPRLDGSRNTGATNVARLCGFKYGVMALVLDVAKGFLPVLGAAAFSQSSLFLGLVALAAVCGHVWSVFLHGKGGKAVATTVGVFLALAPWCTVIAALLLIAVVMASGFVSLGSLTLVTAMPVLLLLSGEPTLAIFAAIIAVIVFWRHRENIQRLARGEEKSWKKKA